MSTARGVALVRAVEMMRSEGERIAEDPNARWFVNPFNVFGLRFMQLTGLDRLIGIAPMLTFAIVREQFIEDIIVAEAKRGLAQVVILGSGFDTRAYRITALKDIPVFEVDHPVTQVQKRAVLQRVVRRPVTPATRSSSLGCDRVGTGIATRSPASMFRTCPCPSTSS